MKQFTRYLAALLLACSLWLPVAAHADDREDYGSDARYAEGTPPTIPHRIQDTANGEYCLGCHRTGLKGAPLCPHPVRLTCTQCHVPGEVKEVKPLKKSRKKQ